MKEIKCPFCGSSNNEDAEFCSVCKVDFRQLPEEIMSSEISKPKEQSASDNSSKEIPAWLADIISRNNRKTQGKMAFDSFADALMGIKPDSDASDSAKKDLSDSEKNEELLYEEKNLTEDSSDQNQKDTLSLINHTNRKSIPDNSSDSIESLPISEPRKNEEQQLEIQEVLNLQDEISEDEELYRDFSVSRPAQKWDLQPLEISNSSVQTDSTEDENLTGGFVSDEQIDVENIETIQKDESEINPTEKIEDYQSTELSSDEKAPLVKTPDTEEPVLTDEERSSISSFEDEINSTEEIIGVKQKSDEAARINFDHSSNDIKRMQEGPSRVSENSDQTSLFADFTPIESEKQTAEAASAFESVDQPLDNNPIEVPAEAESYESDEQNLVSEFLSQINSDVPASESAASHDEHDSSDEILSDEKENDIADLDLILSEAEQPIDEFPTDSDLAEEDSGTQTVDEAGESEPAADTNVRDNPISELKDPFEKAEEPDTIPWNLFESTDIFFPENRKDHIYSSFSKEKIPADFQDRNYQHRMIAAVLSKLFQTENDNRPLKRADTRKTNKIIQAIFALLIFFGVITILISGVTDFIDLKPIGNKQVLSLSTFNNQIASLQEGEQALVIIDFAPGYIDELYAPTLKLIQNMTERKVKVRFATISPSSEMISQKMMMENPQISAENQGFFSGQVAAIQSLISLNADEIKAIFIISSNFQTVKTWIEQIHTKPVNLSLNILASAQMNSLLTPYYDSGLIESSLSGMIEKRYFYQDDFSEKRTNREIFSVWFIILAAIIIYLTGCIDFSTAQPADKDRKHPEKNNTNKPNAKNHSASPADIVIRKNANRNEEKK